MARTLRAVHDGCVDMLVRVVDDLVHGMVAPEGQLPGVHLLRVRLLPRRHELRQVLDLSRVQRRRWTAEPAVQVSAAAHAPPMRTALAMPLLARRFPSVVLDLLCSGDKYIVPGNGSSPSRIASPQPRHGSRATSSSYVSRSLVPPNPAPWPAVGRAPPQLAQPRFASGSAPGLPSVPPSALPCFAPSRSRCRLGIER